MTENNNGAELNLEQILRTLASLPQTPSTGQQAQEQQGFVVPELGLPQFNPESVSRSHSTTSTPLTGYDRSYDTILSSRPAPQHRPPIPRPQSNSSTPLVDSSTITEWKHGLRSVNKLASQNPAFVPTVHKLIKDQERNVKDWEAGRQRIIQDQVAKRENEQAARAAISLPGLLDKTGPLRTPEHEQEELNQYDQKVYRACRQMVELQSAELKRLAVPFFGVRPDLMLPDGGDSINSDDEVPRYASEETEGKITKKQLSELQRQMLRHLVDMYGD
ncbi:hypothetical protein CC78DRAFT_530432 [Lojkania enalia]|uniref:Uncharacterized protein n=1 Tax=Lojkania enalia TaxID=147567 RepID=A0A9P4KHU7_9PLEO|nr:hypothetical protein CC78DRAFT_530432 [Didymosphaeria enalia]